MRRSLALLALVPLLAACTAESPEASPDPTETPVESAPAGLAGDDTLVDFAPDGFQIGTAAAGGGHHQEQSYPDPFSADEDYRAVIAAEYSSLTPENQLKWEYLRPERDVFAFDSADAIADFASDNGQQLRGHTLLWHSQNPSWLENGDFSADELRDILREHIETVVGRYEGRIHQWDVANEIFNEQGNYRNENIWIRELGPDIVADAFRWAHEADPEALLFLNDYSAESINSKSNAYYELAQQLLADGVPVHGFGVQGHLSTQYGFPSDLEANLQRFADLGLETAITEIDVRMPVGADGPSDASLATQAEYYERALDACLSVETCRSFTVWGATDTYSWVPYFFPSEGAATPTWEDFTPKPAYCVMQERLAQAAGLLDDAAFEARRCAA